MQVGGLAPAAARYAGFSSRSALWMALLPFLQSVSLAGFGKMSLQNFRTVFTAPGYLELAANSMMVAAGAAMILGAASTAAAQAAPGEDGPYLIKGGTVVNPGGQRVPNADKAVSTAIKASVTKETLRTIGNTVRKRVA